MAWSLQDIPNQTDNVIVITGANVGLGYESAKALAAKGAEVVVAVRTISKGEDAAQQIRTEVPSAKVHVMELDLADLASIDQFAQNFKAQFNRLDVLMNNAGVMATPQKQTKDGFELQFGTNHLGHFALTGQLLDVLLSTPNSRVVTVSSMAADNGEMHYDDVMLDKNYERFKAYCQSKLANLLFTLGLQRRFDEWGVSSIAVAAHPGVANTELSRGFIGNNFIRSGFKWLSSLFLQSSDQGAHSQLRAATDPSVNGGEYYGPKNGGKGDAVTTPMPDSVDEDDIEKLWALSEQLTNITYEPSAELT